MVSFRLSSGLSITVGDSSTALHGYKRRLVDLSPKLIDVRVPPDPAAAVLVLHGGASRRRTTRVSPAQLSVLRMVPIATRIAREGHGRLAVFRVLNTSRGWDATHTPVSDTHWALDRVRERLGSVRVGLVGHSLGGRAALLSSDRVEVQSTVALAPWVYPTDTVTGIAGKRILFVHGSKDRIASPERAEAVARRGRRQARDARPPRGLRRPRRVVRRRDTPWRRR
jgi:predicted esterase